MIKKFLKVKNFLVLIVELLVSMLVSMLSGFGLLLMLVSIKGVIGFDDLSSVFLIVAIINSFFMSLIYNQKMGDNNERKAREEVQRSFRGENKEHGKEEPEISFCNSKSGFDSEWYDKRKIGKGNDRERIRPERRGEEQERSEIQKVDSEVNKKKEVEPRIIRV